MPPQVIGQAQLKDAEARAEAAEQERDELKHADGLLNRAGREQFDRAEVLQAQLTEAGRELETLRDNHTDRVLECHDLTIKLAEAERAQQALERELREIWWMGHGCVAALYGDDGEMQCGKHLTDFKRMPLDELRDSVRKMQRERMTEAQKALAEPR